MTQQQQQPAASGPQALAIVGLAAKFPSEAANADKLWEFLLQGKCASTPWPEDRFGKGHYHPDPEHGGTHAVKGGHFLKENPANFDAPFFSITKGEAGIMDPQQRVVLENVYQALENAGISLDKARGSNTSVFVSGFNQDHVSNVGQDTETTHRYRTTGLTNCMLSNRVSWFFDFKGPSVTLDTACSSSMTALHLSCQSLLTGESDMAVASGVTILGHPGDINAMSHQGFLGPDGRCYSFDHRANGYARGEGAGSVIVKRLEDAIRDGNTIRAVIRATGVNQDGRTPGLTLPDSGAQERLMRRVYASANLSMDDTMMVEAHGTGTPAGDPIEASAIARCFGPTRGGGKTPLFVGAMKSGLGHLEGAAGIAGVIKAVLILENAIIPPNVNFEKPNPKIPVKRWNLQFPLTATPVPTDQLRRISVNSFGVGGTNAHAVLDDAFHYLQTHGLTASHTTATRVPTLAEVQAMVQRLAGQETLPLTPPDELTIEDDLGTKINVGDGAAASVWDSFGSISPPPQLLALSAFDEAGVARVADVLAACLDGDEAQKRHVHAADVAHTLALRTQFPWRSFALGATSESLQALPKAARARNGGDVRVGFVFTGQGAQWYAMGRELLCFPVFREALEKASSYFQECLGAQWSLLEELARSSETSRLDQAFLSQPVCTALQIAVVDLLQSWGIVPGRVVGHSSGEIAAAYCAGKLTREDAWKVAYFRGVVCGQESTDRGAMMAVGLGEAAVAPHVQEILAQFGSDKHLVVACMNSPSSTTISGDVELIDALKVRLDAEGVFARKLKIEKAYHSPHMEKLAGAYLELLGQLSSDGSSKSKNVTMISSVTGTPVDADQLDAAYWVSNLVSPVRFAEALDRLCFSRLDEKQATLRANTSAGNLFADVLVEVGPHGALQSAIKQIAAAKPEGAAVVSVPVLNRSSPSASTLLNAVGTLFVKGYPIDLDLVNTSSGTVSSPKLLTHLPSYPFNHSQEFWYESRLTRNFRLRKHERHDLLGAPVADWNKDRPRWRHFIRVSEQPWLRDHIVTNAIVWPGVAYLTGVIEAVRQLSESDDGVKGFRLANICLKKALIVPDNKDGIEVQWALAPMDESAHEGSALWRRFEVTSYNANANDWTVHCTGYVAVEYETPTGEVDGGREAREEEAGCAAEQQHWEDVCSVPVDIDRIYDNLGGIGLKFGPLFRNSSQARGTATREGKVVGTLTIPDIAGAMPKHYASPHLIHPATFDGCIHYGLAAMMDKEGRSTLDAPAVPTFIHEVRISAKNPQLLSAPGRRIRVQGNAVLVAYEKYQCDITVWDEATGERLISLRKLRATPLDSSGGLSSGSETRKLCHKLDWHPYLDLATEEMLHRDIVVPPAMVEAKMQGDAKLQLASLLLVSDALDDLEQSGFAIDSADVQPHLKRYFDWMKYLESSIRDDKVSLVKQAEFDRLKHNTAAKKALYEWAQGYSANGELAVRLGSNIAQVFRGDVDPLHLMFGMDDILDRVYAEVANQNQLPQLQQNYLGIMASNCANLAVLEVGAGVGSSTFGLLKALAPVDAETGKRVVGHQCAVAKYTYTDISSAFFEKARDKFAPYQDIMEYRVLDAEKDVGDQGFEQGTYDLVVAQNVVHATADLKLTLGNLRKLLKPGGRLFLQEGTRQDYFWSSIAFGQLSGWWLGVEPFRKWSPWISSSTWNEVLTSAGYSSNILEMRDSQHPDLHTQSVFIAPSPVEAAASAATGSWERAVFITNGPDSVALAETLIKSLQESPAVTLKVPCAVLDVNELGDADLSHDLVISLAEIESPVLDKLDCSRYESIKKMLTVCKGLLWVTGDAMENPHYAMISGLMRSNRWERDLDDANLVTLTIAEPKPDTARLTQHLARLVQDQFLSSGASDTARHQGEYLLRDDQFFTNRLHTNTEANGFLTSRLEKPGPVPTFLKDAGRPIKLSVASPGLLDRLEWVTDEVYNEALAPTHVEVEVKAVGLNFRDLMIAMGEHMAISIGCEAAGIVTRVGSEVGEYKVGDRVTYITGLDNVGCLRTFGRVDQSVLVKIPDGLSFEDAAGLPCVYATVIFSLRETGRLEKGEKILIHAAAGGVGQAAIRYAQWIGAEVFATVSTTTKKQLLMDEFGIPESHIFSSRDLSFFDGIKRVTNGYGVDVVLNSLSGEALRRSWDLIAPFGRFIEIGKKDAQINGKLDLHQFLNHVTMASVDLSTMMRRRPALIKRMLDETMRLWSEGVAKPAKPTKIMGMGQVEEGLRLLQSGKGMGKIIVVPRPDDVLPIVPAQAAEFALRSDATYVLSGGLGGLGRSMARWMAARGARFFVFLSSSGKITDPVATMKAELKAIGCAIHIFKCDVSDRDSIVKVLAELRATPGLPPIKGVIQGAMKLQDSMFENMSHDMWQAAVRPKVQGSWHLHELLPRDLDHFVMLSSATGILGNRSQANYAAGNTFQDALALHRRRQGLAACTIDVGTVIGVGYVAENLDRVAINKHFNTVLETISEEELHLLMEYAMTSGSEEQQVGAPAQLVTGLSDMDSYRRRGVPPPTFLSYPMFTRLRQVEPSSSAASAQGDQGDGSAAIEARLGAAQTLDEAAQVVADAIVAKLASLLSISIEDINADKSVSSHGVDSLVAMEFRTFLARVIKADVPVLQIMDTLSIRELSKSVAKVSKVVQIAGEVDDSK